MFWGKKKNNFLLTQALLPYSYMKKTTSLPNISTSSLNNSPKSRQTQLPSINHSTTATTSTHTNLLKPLHHTNSEINLHLFSDKLTHFKINRLRSLKPLFVENNYNKVFNLISNESDSLNTNNNQQDTDLQNFFKENPSITNELYSKNYISKFHKLKITTKPEEQQQPQHSTSIFNKTKYSSSNSVKAFYTKYQQYNNLSRKHPNMFVSPSLAFIKASQRERIVPNAIGLIKRNYSEDKESNYYQIDLTNQKRGDSYMKALSSSIEKLSQPLNALMLSSNRLSHHSMDSLFKAIMINDVNVLSTLKHLDLSCNSISTFGTNKLMLLLANANCVIEHLNLESNHLKDKNIISITTCISQSLISKKIKYVNLNNNFISDESSNSIANMIEHCVNLQVIMLSQNSLHNQSGVKLITKLKQLNDLRVLDLSWNNLGNHLLNEPQFEEITKHDHNPSRKYRNFELNEIKTKMHFIFKSNPHSPVTASKKPLIIKIPPHKVSPFTKELCDYIAHLSSYKSKLVHLDISHNNLSYEDCECLSIHIKQNHSILGIHVDGNEMSIDSLGFVHAYHSHKSNALHSYSKSHLCYGINLNPFLRRTSVDNIRNLRNNNNCWICEGWNEHEFVYTPSCDEKVNAKYISVRIHLSFDNYEGCDMMFNGRYFHVYRMCPPGIVTYCYTVDTKVVNDYGKDTYTVHSHKECIHIAFDDKYFDELHNKKLQQAHDNNNNSSNISIQSEYNKTITVNTFGKVNIRHNLNVIDNTYTTTLKHCEPRPRRSVNIFIKPRTPWTFPKSIWATYGYDYNGIASDHLNECFEHDFKRCQLEKEFVNANTLCKVKEMLRQHYIDIVNCYKYLSSYSGFTVWQISQNVLLDWIGKCEGLCDRKYDINGVLLVQTGICANVVDKEERVKNKNKNLSDNLVRHQFMSLIAKMPKDKYIRSK